MASQLSDLLDLVGCLRESARRGDWKSAGELAASLRRQALPANPRELGEYLRRLKEALIVAKVSRAHAAASLAALDASAAVLNQSAGRLSAAARYHVTRSDFAPGRQEPAETAHSWRPGAGTG